MKKLLILLVSLMLMLSLVLTSCGGEESSDNNDNGNNDSNNNVNDGNNDENNGNTDDGNEDDGKGDDDEVELPAGHSCVYSTDWSFDAQKHWHETTCADHDAIKKDEAEHNDDELDGACDVCGAFMYHVVKVTAPSNVTVDETTFKVEDGGKIEINAKVSNKFVLSMEGAKVSGPVQELDTNSYKFTVSNIKTTMDLEVVAEQTVFITDVTSGEAEFEQLDAFYNYATFDVELPAAGTYVIFCDRENVLFIDPFSEEDNKEGVYGGVTEFVAPEAGTVTVTASYFDINHKTDPETNEPIINPGFDFFWQVIERDTEMTVKSDEGEGYVLPTNTNFTLHFTVAEPGFHWLTSTANVTWNDSLGYGMFVKTDVPNEQVDVVVRCNDPIESAFDFDWSLKRFEQKELTEGANDISLDIGDYQQIHFTVTEDGTYRFDVEDINTSLYYWVVSVETDHEYLVNSSTVYYTDSLKPGDEVMLFVCNNSYSVDDVINVTYIGHGVNKNEGIVYATVDGYVNSFTNSTPDDITYSISLGKDYTDYQLGIFDDEGNVTWTSACEMTIKAYSVTRFLVKGPEEGEIPININQVYYEFQLEPGMNIIEVLPGKEYEITIADIPFFADFKVVWDNPDLTALWNYAEYESGEVIQYQFYAFNFIYSGDTAATIQVSLIDLSETEEDTSGGFVPSNNDPLVVGENTVNIYSGSGVTISFTATATGTYVINKASSNEEIMLYTEIVDDINGTQSVLVEFPYSFELEAGETVEFEAFTLVPGGTGIAKVVITKQ